MADQQPPTAKAQILNDRTYQEVEYLKKNLGPILVAALAEICIRRPADPIEYLGHWLLRWRYNEELKRRDVQNALEVVRQKAWTKDDEHLAPNPTAPDQPPSPQTFTQGFVPGAPYAPPGFGGPLDSNAVEQLAPPEEVVAAPAPVAPEPTPEGEVEKIPSGGNAQVEPAAEGEKRGSTGERRGSVQQEKRPSQGAGATGEVKVPSGEVAPADQGQKRDSNAKRPSGDAAEAEKRNSTGAEKRNSTDAEKRNSTDAEKRASAGAEGKRPSKDIPDANNAASEPAQPVPPAEPKKSL